MQVILTNYSFDEVKEFLINKGLWKTQAFNTRNIVGDPMRNIYNKDGVSIDYCSQWEYIEIFGLSDEDYVKLPNHC